MNYYKLRFAVNSLLFRWLREWIAVIALPLMQIALLGCCRTTPG